MLFCPHCGNILLVEGASRGLRFFCQTCPYIHTIDSTVRKVVPLKRKKVADALGSEDAWKLAETTQAVCPHCGHDTAYFQQIQTRSADEASSIFYKCEKCAGQWKEV